MAAFLCVCVCVCVFDYLFFKAKNVSMAVGTGQNIDVPKRGMGGRSHADFLYFFVLLLGVFFFR